MWANLVVTGASGAASADVSWAIAMDESVANVAASRKEANAMTWIATLVKIEDGTIEAVTDDKAVTTR